MFVRRLISVCAMSVAAMVVACAPHPAPGTPSADPSRNAASGGATPTSLTVVVEEPFVPNDRLKQGFKTDKGIDLTFVTPPEGVSLEDFLAKNRADVVVGLDNITASHLAPNLVVPYDSPALPDEANHFKLPGLTPIGFADICLNADKTWFEKRDIPLPTTFDELVDPLYRDLTAVPNPATSSAGTAFLLATISTMGDNWQEYWSHLAANGVKLTPSLTEAYRDEFTGSGGLGRRPITLGFGTAPANTVTTDSKGEQQSSTVTLNATCFRQLQYVGLLSQNNASAHAFVDYLLSPDVQRQLPSAVLLYPVLPGVDVPPSWRKFAPPPHPPLFMESDQIAAKLPQWLKEWKALGIG